MTQLGMGVAALNHDSVFAAAYEKGIKKTDYWTYAYEDCINLLAKLPALAARIYRNAHKPGQELPAIQKDLDLVGEYIYARRCPHHVDNWRLGNYSNMLGFGNNQDMTEYLRLYIAIHGDHEGGNASAQYLSYVALYCYTINDSEHHFHRLGRIDAFRSVYFVFCGTVCPRRATSRVCFATLFKVHRSN